MATYNLDGVRAVRGEDCTSPGLFFSIERFGDALAVIDENGGRLTYRQLAAIADDAAPPHSARKQLVALEATNTLRSLVAYIGAIRSGSAVILLKPGSGNERMLSQYKPSYLFSQEVGRWVLLQDSSELAVHPDLAVLLSSSGSSGAPKLIRLSHRNLVSNANAIAEYLELRTDDRSLTTLPPFYSYGMSVIHSHLTLGASLILDHRSVTEPQFWSRFTAERGTNFAGVPHTFALLKRTQFLESPPESLRFVTAAGGKLPPDDALLFASTLERAGARLFIMYGQTEASPRIAYLPAEEVRLHPGAIGRAIPGGELALRGEDGREVRGANVTGELVYRGPNVMMGYAEGPADLARGSETKQLNTGDVAVRDQDGVYTIVGRLHRFVKPFGLRINLDDVEDWCRARGREVAITGNDDAIILATIGDGKQLCSDLAAKLALPPSSIVLLPMDELPRLASGKIDYPAVQRLGLQTRFSSDVAGEGSIAAGLGQLLGLTSIPADQSFIDAGGDSLSIVAASMLLEEHLERVPDNWERLPMAQLEQPDIGDERRATVEPATLARCICILLVVLHHGADIALEGAAVTLLIIAGFTFGRLQARSVMAQGPFRTALRTLSRILPIYITIMALYFILKQDLFLPNLLFYSTFTSGYDDGNTVIGLYWFIETYAWIFIFSCFLVAIPKFADWHDRSSLLFPIVILSVGVLAHVLTMPDASSARAADYRSPVFLFYMFGIGWALNFATSSLRKIAMSLAAVLILILFPAHRIDSGVFITVSVVLLMLWTTRVEMPTPNAARLIGNIAHSSFYIYLVHPVVFMSLGELIPDNFSNQVPARVIATLALTIPLSVVGGLLLQAVMIRTEQKLGTMWPSKPRKVGQLVA